MAFSTGSSLMYSFLLAFVLATVCQGFIFKRDPRPKINGAWSGWDSWSECYQNANTTDHFFQPWDGFTVMHRNRSCTKPLPRNGGRTCQGESHRYRQCGCQNALGMESGRITANQLSSSPFLEGFSPDKGRLNNGGSLWCSSESLNLMSNVYYEVDLVNLTRVTRIALVGSSMGRVSEYKVTYSIDGRNKWQHYKDSKNTNGVLAGNKLTTGVQSYTFEGEIMARFIRVYPTAHYGPNVCLGLELYGCIFTCGGVLNGSTGEIKAGSKQQYDQSCAWKIEVLQTTSISLDFLVFDLPCDSAWLELRDGRSPYVTAPVLERVCGEDARARTLDFNSIWLRFESNSSAAETGFTLRYQAECAHTVGLNEGQTTTIQTPNFPRDYYHNSECTWTISANTKSFLEINFDVMDIEGSTTSTGSSSCQTDFISVVRLNAAGGQTEVGRYCNSNKPTGRVRVPSQNCRVLFKSDDAISSRGFKASVTAVSMETPVTDPTVKTGLNWTPGVSPVSSTSDNGRDPHSVAGSTGNGVSSTESSDLPSNSSDHIHVTKRKTGRDDQWTTILIGTFSGVVLVMVASVLGMNLKKFMSGRQTRTIIVTTPSYPAFGKKAETKKVTSTAPLLEKPCKTDAVPSSSQDSSASDALLNTSQPETVEMTAVAHPTPPKDEIKVDVSNSTE